MNERRMTDTYQEDEISLVDVWWTLARHKKVIFLVWGLISLIGVAVAVLMPQKYAYTTLIEIGGHGDDVVETADAARVRLVAGIIPVIQSRYLAEGKETIDVNVSVPEKSPSFVLLESKGTAQAASIHLAFQEAVFDALRQEHQAVLNKAREALAAGQEAVEHKIAGLQDERVLLAADAKRLNEEETYLNNQAIKFDAGSALVRTMLIKQIELQRAVIGKATADNVRAMDEQRSALNIITSELGRIRETKAVIPAAQSVDPVAPDRKLIIVLTVVGGLMLGLLSAFFAEFFLKVRKEAGTHPA